MLASDVSLTQELLNLIDSYKKKHKKDIQQSLKKTVETYIRNGDFLKPVKLVNMFFALDLQLKRNAVRSETSSIREIIYGDKKGVFGDMHKIIEDMQSRVIEFLVENNQVEALKTLNSYFKKPSDFYSEAMNKNMNNFKFQIDKLSPNQPVEAYYDYLAARRWKILVPIMNESTNPEIAKMADESATDYLEKFHSKPSHSFFIGAPGFSRRRQGLFKVMKKIADAYMADSTESISEDSQKLNERISQFNCDLLNHTSKTSRKFSSLDCISYFDISNYNPSKYDELRELLDNIENNEKPDLVIALGNKIRTVREQLLKEIKDGYLPRHPVHRECIDKINDLIRQYNSKIKDFDYGETKSAKGLFFKTESVRLIKHQLNPSELIMDSSNYSMSI